VSGEGDKPWLATPLMGTSMHVRWTNQTGPAVLHRSDKQTPKIFAKTCINKSSHPHGAMFPCCQQIQECTEPCATSIHGTAHLLYTDPETNGTFSMHSVQNQFDLSCPSPKPIDNMIHTSIVLNCTGSQRARSQPHKLDVGCYKECWSRMVQVPLITTTGQPTLLMQ
jgi:hypothetical protein